MLRRNEGLRPTRQAARDGQREGHFRAERDPDTLHGGPAPQ